MSDSMKDVDKALKEEEKRDEKLAKDISKALNERDYEEKCACEHASEASLSEDRKEEDAAVKKVLKAEDKAMSDVEHHHCGCHKH